LISGERSGENFSLKTNC